MQITQQLAKETAREYAFRVLKKNIVSMELVPGTIVSEKELADELGMSRTPVREALIELSRSSVIEIMPQRGSRIALIDMDVVEEAIFFRIILEKAICELVCDMAKEEDLARLEENLQLQEFYLLNKNTLKLLQLDNEFHRMLFQICRKERIYQLMESMTVPLDRVRNLPLMGVRDIKIVSDHRNILTAIETKDKMTAVTLMERHLTRYQLNDEELRSKYPDYFK